MANVQHIEKLDETNFESWKLMMRSVLICNELWSYVSGAIVKTEQNRAEWTLRDDKALALITLSVKTNQLSHIKRAQSSKEAWDTLVQMYESRGPVRKASLYKQLYRMKKETSQSMSSYISSFCDIIEKLEEAGIQIPNELLSIMILNSLPFEYENFCIAIESRDVIPSIEILKAKLIEEEARQLERDNKHAIQEENDALYTKNKPKSNNNNKYNKSNQRDIKTKSKFPGKCFKCEKPGHKAADCRSAKKHTTKANTEDAMSATVLSSEAHQSTEWCLDSGATRHMCNDPEKFHELDSGVRCEIHTAANHRAKSIGTGTVKLNVKLKGNEANQVKLQNTLLVPEFQNNLLSVSCMTDNDYTVIFTKDFAEVKRRDGTIALKAERRGQLYVANEIELIRANTVTTNNVQNKNKQSRWHERYGHLNFRDLNKLKQEDMVKNMDMNQTRDKFTCEVCDKGKIHQLPYKDSVNYSTEKLELVHSDICGPFNIESIGGAKYFAVFIDDYTRYQQVVMLKKRSDILNVFKIYKKRVEKETGYFIKRIRTDAKEYVSKEFTSYLEAEGIKRELSVEYTPQQNGVAERANRTLVEMARCMLIQSKLPKSLWGEAINTAAFIRNRCPSKRFTSKTPMEMWCGRKPYVGFLRIFGSKVIALNKGTRRNKFEPKGDEYILVGYSEESKTYRLWKPKTKNVVKRRDVRFNEKLSKESIETDEYFEAPLHILETNEKSTEMETSEETEPEEKDDEDSSENLVPSLSPRKSSDDISAKSIIRRAPGRPKILRSGQKGRPRKLFHETANSTYKKDLDEPESVEAIYDREDNDL